MEKSKSKQDLVDKCLNKKKTFKNPVEKSLQEEKEANNELTLSAIIHFIIIIMVLIVMACRLNLSTVQKEENYDQIKFVFSLFDFTHLNGIEKHVYKYSCIQTLGECTYLPECEKPLKKQIAKFEGKIRCDDIYWMGVAGILVRYIVIL
jgi:hypothetical protein